MGMDRALEALYGASGGGGMSGTAGADRRGGLGSSAPSVARWLGDIRSYFPSSVVSVMQKDADASVKAKADELLAKKG